MFSGSSGFMAYQASPSPFKRDPFPLQKKRDVKIYTTAPGSSEQSQTHKRPRLSFGFLSLNKGFSLGVDPLTRQEKQTFHKLQDSLPPEYFDVQALSRLLDSNNPFTILLLRQFAQVGLPKHKAQVKRVVQQARLRMQEELEKRPAKEIAIAFDIDNTLLDATGLELAFDLPILIPVKRQIQMAHELVGLHHVPSQENIVKLSWMLQAQAPPIDDVCKFLHELRESGVKVYLATGRMDLPIIKEATIQNLDKAGITKNDYEGIYFKNPDLSVNDGKAAIYHNIEDKLGHPLFFVMGDQEYDRSGIENSGTLFYLLPNPVRRNNPLKGMVMKAFKKDTKIHLRDSINIFG